MTDAVIDVNTIEARDRGQAWADLLGDIDRAIKGRLRGKVAQLDAAGLTLLAHDLRAQLETVLADAWGNTSRRPTPRPHNQAHQRPVKAPC